MTLVHTDDRRRVSLGKVLQPNRDYRVSVSAHGTVTLEPVTTTTVSDFERSLLADPDRARRLEQGAAALDRGEMTARARRQRS